MDDQAFDELMAGAGLTESVATELVAEPPVEATSVTGLQETQSPDDAQPLR